MDKDRELDDTDRKVLTMLRRSPDGLMLGTLAERLGIRRNRRGTYSPTASAKVLALKLRMQRLARRGLTRCLNRKIWVANGKGIADFLAVSRRVKPFPTSLLATTRGPKRSAGATMRGTLR